MPVPFVFYADFEAITEKVYGCQPDGAKSYTDKYQKHTGCSYGYKVVCCYDEKYSKPVKIYRGENFISYFMLEFYSILTDEGISDEQYQHAQKVWNTFNMRTMGVYHNLYLKSKILLSADLFENFRKAYHQYYKLDHCHYFTSPGLPWDAMLKMTDISGALAREARQRSTMGK